MARGFQIRGRGGEARTASSDLHLHTRATPRRRRVGVHRAWPLARLVVIVLAGRVRRRLRLLGALLRLARRGYPRAEGAERLLDVGCGERLTKSVDGARLGDDVPASGRRRDGGISGGGSDARASGVAERAWPRDGSHPSGGPTGSGARRECWWLEQQVGSSAGAAASGGRRHDERGGSEGGG